jgi:hypothetical protein
MAEWRFEIGGKTVDASAVRSVAVERRASFAIAGGTVRTERRDAADFVNRYFQSAPIDLAGVAIAGFQTATVTLTFADGATAEFAIYNDRMAVEQTTRTAYYTSSLGLLGG